MLQLTHAPWLLTALAGLAVPEPSSPNTEATTSTPVTAPAEAGSTTEAALAESTSAPNAEPTPPDNAASDPNSLDANFAAESDWLSAVESLTGVELQWTGRVQTETHFRIAEKLVGKYYDRRRLPDGFVRNENTLGLRLDAKSGRLRAIADIDFDWIGFSQAADLGALTVPEEIAPYRLQANALYFEANDIFLEGLDLRFGQQLVLWGVGDQFNPTNVVNSEDLENVLLFGKQQSNLMARADFALGDRWTISSVVVPVFRPALLPGSAPFGLVSVDRLPFLSDALRHRLHTERALASTLGSETVVRSVSVRQPELNLNNMQYAARLAGSLFEQDIAVSYYTGRNDFPLAVQNYVEQIAAPQCDPADITECIAGTLSTDVEVRYPRFQMVGLNLAGELDVLGWISDAVQPIGYRLELGVFFPREQRFKIIQDDINIGVTVPGGEYDYRMPDGRRPVVLESTPFAKWVIGLDYSFSRYIYFNGMWVHGIVDEFGAGDMFHEAYNVRSAQIPEDRNVGTCYLGGVPEQCPEEVLRPKLGDYAVVGFDIRFADQQGLLRLFAIFDLTGLVIERWDDAQQRRVRTSYGPTNSRAFSAVLFPQVDYNFGNGLELSAGALIQLGKDDSKFGEAAAGGSLAWFRGKYAF